MKRQAIESRVRGTSHLVAAIEAAARPPRVLVSASAVGYYGVSPAGTVTESSPPGDDFMARLCREWESAARGAERLGVRVVLVRTGVVLHPDEGALQRLLVPFRFFVGGPIGSGNQPVPWIHLEDELEMLLWALRDESVVGPINAVAPGVVTNRELATAIGQVLRRPSVFPAPALAVTLVLGEGSVIVTHGQRVAPKRAEELGYRFRFPRLREALADLLA